MLRCWWVRGRKRVCQEASKDFETGQEWSLVSWLRHQSRLSDSVGSCTFHYFYIRMTLVHSKVSGFRWGGMQLIIALWISTIFYIYS